MSKKDYPYNEAEIDYRAGLMSVRAVADKHGIPEANLRREAKARGWIRGSAAAKRELVNEMMAAGDAAVTQELTQEQVRQSQIDAATQDVADMNRGLTVARSCLQRLEAMAGAAESPRDVKAIVEAAKGAVEIVRKIRCLDAEPVPVETTVNVDVSDGFDELRQAFRERLQQLRGEDAGQEEGLRNEARVTH